MTISLNDPNDPNDFLTAFRKSLIVNCEPNLFLFFSPLIKMYLKAMVNRCQFVTSSFFSSKIICGGGQQDQSAINDS